MAVDQETPTKPDPTPPTSARSVRRGTWLLGVGGTLLAMGAVTRLAATGLAIDDFDCRSESECEESGFVGGIALALISDSAALPVLAIATGLIGGGLARRGRWQADEDRKTGTRRPSWNARRNARLGIGLLGASAGVIVVTASVGLWALFDGRGTSVALGVHEGGFYAGAGLVAAGMALGPFALGYRRAAPRIRASPTVSARGAGLSLFGRF